MPQPPDPSRGKPRGKGRRRSPPATHDVDGLRRRVSDLGVALEHVQDLVLLFDREFRVVHANSAVARFLGMPIAEIVGKTCCQLYQETRLLPQDCLIGAVAESKRPVEAEVHIGDKGRWLWVSVNPILDSQGEMIGAVHLARDITERKRVEQALQDVSVRHEAMFNAMTNGVAVYRAVDDGEDFIFTDVNKAVERIERLPREEMIGRRVTEVFPGVRDLGLLDAMRRVWRTGEPEHCPLGFYRDQRIVGWRENFVYRLTGGEVVAVYSDETDRKQAEESLRHSEERFRTFFESAHDLMAICDLDGRPVWRNAAWERVIGETSEGDPFLAGDRVHPQDRDRSRQAWESLRAGQAAAIAAEFRFQDRRGEFIFLDLSARRAQAGDRGLICAVVRDVTERKRQEAELVRLASRDPLTGLFNRRRFEEELGRQLAEAVRYKTHGALLWLDLDNFKDINDSFGHRFGDRLLTDLSIALRDRLRKADVLARMGGDEFAVLLPHADGAAATNVARILVDLVSRYAAVIEDKPVRLSTSIGIALYPEHGVSAEDLLARADIAMYQAKEQGRNRFCVYEHAEDWPSRIQSRVASARLIREALDNNLFVLYAQPVLDVREARVTQYEILLRLVGERGAIVLPGSFLPAAERFSLMSEIDRWVVSQALRFLSQQTRGGRDLRLSVNLSGRAVSDEGLSRHIEEELARSGAPPQNLVLEITETAAIVDFQRAQEFVVRLKGLGCSFAIDDFGMGFSSFYQLKHLPVDYLKIDGSFILNLCRDEVDQCLVRSMVHLARGLGKKTVAEFVESAETLGLVQGYGVDFAQGYFIGAPAPIIEALD